MHSPACIKGQRSLRDNAERNAYDKHESYDHIGEASRLARLSAREDAYDTVRVSASDHLDPSLGVVEEGIANDGGCIGTAHCLENLPLERSGRFWEGGEGLHQLRIGLLTTRSAVIVVGSVYESTTLGVKSRRRYSVEIFSVHINGRSAAGRKETRSGALLTLPASSSISFLSAAAFIPR